MPQSNPRKGLKGIRVGLVDDHNLFRNGVKIILEQSSEFRICIEAENGKDLIEKWKNLSNEDYPDIMLVDINMPEMDGFQTVEWLGKNHQTVKIAILTMYSNSSEMMVRMVKLGVNAYLTKDMAADEIKESLREIIQDRNSFPDNVANLLIESIRDSDLQDKQDQESRVKKLFHALPAKEAQVARLFCTELTYNQIAEKLSYTTRAIETFRVSLFHKFQVTTRVGLAVLLVKYNLAEL
jgi:two-component system invasion response regulator UvrY